MQNEIVTNIKSIRFTSQQNREDVLALLSTSMLEEGWVLPGHTGAVLEREERFPTGLHTKGVEIAIPHADPKWTVLPAMVVGFLEQPVIFKPMGGVGLDVEAQLVFLLAIQNPDDHIEFLKSLVSIFEDEDFMKDFVKTKKVENLISKLINNNQ
jgi:PTS system galactitol-specific IIA component